MSPPPAPLAEDADAEDDEDEVVVVAAVVAGVDLTGVAVLAEALDVTPAVDEAAV